MEMKVALTVWENRISPLFDCARMLFIVDITKNTANSRHFEPFPYKSPFSRATKLTDIGVEVLICGAVSNLFADIIESHGIKIIPFVTGPVDEVLDAYLTNRLNDPKFRMPGCKNKLDNDFRENN